MNLPKRKTWLLLLYWLWAGSLAAQPAPEPDVKITIKAVPGLKFDLGSFQVQPGARVQLTLTNADDMDHNLVITQPGAREQVVQAALKLGAQGPEKGFVPASPLVLWAIPVLAPDQSQSITFTAPAKTGDYPYVCTYPGHGFVMFGTMQVAAGKMAPPATGKTAAAKSAGGKTAGSMASAHAGHGPPRPPHPYTPVAPYLYRIFIEGASPAAIAVRLPGSLAYCWDAGSCRLRFAWQGGFLDNSDLWKGKGDALARVTGKVFFRDQTPYPLRLGKAEALPVVDYKGYRLVNGFPEFRYTLDGTEVQELLQPKADSSGLVRRFRIPRAGKTVWFAVDPGDGVRYQASAGRWRQGLLKLSPRQARDFTITMTKKEGVQP
ncbi:MAG: plastocyanin/azurin family copper-binding protein [Adhaeribacter sp.]